MTAKLPPVARDKCGEYRGWMAHQQNGEDPCRPCVGARNAYMRNYRRTRGLTAATLYTPAQIAALQAEAVHAALRGRARAHLTGRASRQRIRP